MLLYIMRMSDKNNIALILIVIGTIIFFTFIMPMVDKKYYNKINENFSSPITNNNEPELKLDQNKCSTSCCGLSQWPVPSELQDKNISQEELKKYIPSNFGCTAGDYSGCVCLTQENYDYLNSHGNNSSNSQCNIQKIV